jgi:polyhydroxyalkanoate synthesis regulator phasin
VNDILEAEGKASKDECKRMARALMRQQKRTKQALPEALVEFVGRHLDREQPGR